MPNLSVITPTIRKEGLPLVAQALAKQTFKDFEWLICSPFDPVLPQATWIPDTFTGGQWSLNRAYNALMKQAQGTIIISWQDWVWALPTALEQFITVLSQVGSAAVSGIGDQYERLGQWGKPEIKIWSDPRKTFQYGDVYECMWNDIEWNFCALPKHLLVDVGGFDEEMDQRCRGVDAIQVMERLDALGYKTYLDQRNESFTLRHDRSAYGGEQAWNASHGLFNGEAAKRKQELIASGQWPRLTFL